MLDVQRPPGHVAAALAWLLVTGALVRCRREPSHAVRERMDELTVELDPRRMSARELRQLPGVGARLAGAIARARDGHAGPAPLAWEDVPGIGEARAAAIREWLAERGIATDPLAGPLDGAASRYPVTMNRDTRAALSTLALLAASCGETPRESDAPRAPTEVRAAAPESVHAAEDEVRALTLAVEGGQLAALAAGDEKAPLVLLLHGARYRAENWRELGTLAELARNGWRAVAIDWPGFGASTAFTAEPQPAPLLAQAITACGAERALVIGPSMGGGFALALVAEAPERVAGLVAIAPAGIESFEAPATVPPALLLWGENDEVVPVSRAQELASRMPGARVEILPAASHACYLDAPERFHEFVTAFAREVFARGQ